MQGNGTAAVTDRYKPPKEKPGDPHDDPAYRLGFVVGGLESLLYDRSFQMGEATKEKIRGLLEVAHYGRPGAR